MSFQVSFSAYQQFQGVINSFTAGEDQLNFCGTYVYLDAIVDGDLRGHTVEWEQLTGIPVTIQDGTTVNAFFERLENSDKEFRFWIDRGRTTEQFDDIIVYGTPTDFLPTTFRDVSADTFNAGITLTPVECSSIVGFTNIVANPPTQLYGDAGAAVAQLEINWSLPTTASHAPFLINMVVYKDGLPVATFDPADQLVHVDTQGTFSIQSNYDFGTTQSPSSMSCETLILPEVSANRVLDDAAEPSFDATVTFATNVFLPIVQQILDVSIASFLSSAVFAKTTYVNEIQTVVDLTSSSFEGGVTLNIIRYDPQAIGG